MLLQAAAAAQVVQTVGTEAPDVGATGTEATVQAVNSAVPFAHELAGHAPQVAQVHEQASAVLGLIPMSHGLILAGILFAIGLCGVMVRRNFLFMLMSLEIMMNAAALAFVVAGSRWVDPDGQVMFIFILTLAAAEASIGLAILLQFYHKRGHLDVDSANEMKG